MSLSRYKILIISITSNADITTALVFGYILKITKYFPSHAVNYAKKFNKEYRYFQIRN